MTNQLKLFCIIIYIDYCTHAYNWIEIKVFLRNDIYKINLFLPIGSLCSTVNTFCVNGQSGLSIPV